MSPEQIVLAVVDAGGFVQAMPDGRVSLKGEVPSEVLAAIKANREAFLEAWEDYQRNRWLRPPPTNLPLRAKPPHFNALTRKRVETYVMQQGGDVARWALLRATRYQAEKSGWTETQCASSACSDVIHWQLERHPAPVNVIMDLHEAAEGMTP
jgi:hypothetical protein